MERGEYDNFLGNAKIRITPIDPALNGAEKWVKDNKGQILAAGVLVVAAPASGSVQINIDTPTAFGIAGALAGFTEEMLEKGHENWKSKTKAVLKKTAAGFGVGWAGTHAVEGNPGAIDYVIGLWSVITIHEETNITDLLARFAKKAGGAVTGTVGKVPENINFNHNWEGLERAIKAAHYSGVSQSQIAEKDAAIERLANYYHLQVYKTNRRHQITGVDMTHIDRIYGMMGRDHRLQKHEVEAIFSHFGKPGEQMPGQGE
jgi:hypothetical protein